MPDEELNRGCWDEILTLRAIVGVIFTTPYAISQLLGGKTRSGLFWLAIAAVCAWGIYAEFRPADYRLGDHRRARRARRNHSA